MGAPVYAAHALPARYVMPNSNAWLLAAGREAPACLAAQERHVATTVAENSPAARVGSEKSVRILYVWTAFLNVMAALVEETDVGTNAVSAVPEKIAPNMVFVLKQGALPIAQANNAAKTAAAARAAHARKASRAALKANVCRIPDRNNLTPSRTQVAAPSPTRQPTSRVEAHGPTPAFPAKSSNMARASRQPTRLVQRPGVQEAP